MSNAIKLMSAATIAASAACAAMAQDAQDFRITDIVAIDIDTTPGQPPFLFIPDPDTHGTIGLNNNNQICYTRRIDGVLTAFIWLPEPAYGLSAGLHTLNPPSGITGPCIARDLTDNGIVVGQAGDIEPAADDAVACYWDLNNSTTAVSLGQLEEDRWSGAFRVIEYDSTVYIFGVGEIMGDCECSETDPTEDNNEVDVAWYVELDDPLPSLTILQPNTAHNSQNSWVRGVGVNSSGDIRVAGDDFCGGRPDNPGPSPKCPADASCEPFTDGLYWTIPSASPSLLSKFSGGGGWRGRGVNNHDEFVGLAYNSSCVVRAGLWLSATASICDLGAIMPSGSSANDSRAQAINNSTPRMVVGWDIIGIRGLLWIQNGTGSCPNNWSVIDLNATASSGCWTARRVHDVNDNGWIVAEAEDERDANPNRHIVLIRYVGPTGCIADLGNETTCPDGVVDVADLFILLAEWGDCEECQSCPTDFTGPSSVPDCDTNVHDLFYLLARWGPCENPLGFVPTSVDDCIEEFGLGEENRDKLEACLEALELIEGQ